MLPTMVLYTTFLTYYSSDLNEPATSVVDAWPFRRHGCCVLLRGVLRLEIRLTTKIHARPMYTLMLISDVVEDTKCS